MRTRLLIGLSAVFLAHAAIAQQRAVPGTAASTDQDDEQLPVSQPQRPLDTTQQGRVTGLTVGQVGQRQTRDAAAAEIGIKPMARIANRIDNRVQNRISSRIDRNHVLQTGSTDVDPIVGSSSHENRRSR